MKILLENLGGATSQPNTVQQNIEDMQILKKEEVRNESDFCEGMFKSKAEYVQAEVYVEIQTSYLSEALKCV